MSVSSLVLLIVCCAEYVLCQCYVDFSVVILGLRLHDSLKCCFMVFRFLKINSVPVIWDVWVRVIVENEQAMGVLHSIGSTLTQIELWEYIPRHRGISFLCYQWDHFVW